MAISRKIKSATAGELYGAVRSKVGSLAQHVELLNIENLVGDREPNGILIVEFDVLVVEGKSGEIATHGPSCGLEQLAVKIEYTGHRGVSGKLSAEIGMPKRVEINLIHTERKIGGIIFV